MKHCLGALVLAVVTAIALDAQDEARTVSVTPIGSRTGEFCGADRALLFQDPTGVSILYDPGTTVAGGADARLGEVHVILVSHAHGDHLGGARLNHDPNANAGTCGAVATLPATPHSNAGQIAAAKASAFLAGGALAGFVGLRIQDLRGVPTPACPAAGPTNELTVPRSSPCAGGVGLGSKRTVRHEGAIEGVQIASVPAAHPNELAPAFLNEPERTDLLSNGTGAYVGVANGFVVSFTNGLTVYLSGDTGVMADMATVVNGLYSANLAVLNIGDIFTTGPEEAAYAVKRLVKPRAVIPSHANEAATAGGAVIAGTRTARFIELVRGTPVYVPRSGMTMSFDGHARCVAGCS